MIGAELVGFKEGGHKYKYPQSSPNPKREGRTFLDDPKPQSLEKKIEESPNSAIKVDVNNLEIFNSSKKDLLQPYKDLQEFEKNIKKRIITQPCSLFYHVQNFTCLCKNEIKYVNSMDIHLSKLQANLSYKDIILLYETMLIQQEEMAKSNVLDTTAHDLSEKSLSKQVNEDNSKDFSQLIEKKNSSSIVQEKKSSQEGEIQSEKTKKFSIEKLELVRKTNSLYLYSSYLFPFVSFP
jgi:hypothetical protein